MIWRRNFREACCAKWHCTARDYENRALPLALHRRSLPVAWLVRSLYPAFFVLERRSLKFLGNATGFEEFRAELDAYRSEYRRHGGFLRNALGIRLSGRRLMRVVEALADDSNGQG